MLAGTRLTQRASQKRPPAPAPTPRFLSQQVWVSLRICISNTFPSHADAADPRSHFQNHFLRGFEGRVKRETVLPCHTRPVSLVQRKVYTQWAKGITDGSLLSLYPIFLATAISDSCFSEVQLQILSDLTLRQVYYDISEKLTNSQNQSDSLVS